MENATLLQSRASLILDLPPSCIQFCPSHPQYFIVGTYDLQADAATSANTGSSPVARAQSRNGSLIVFRLNGDNVELIQTIEQPSAILDIRFREGIGNGDTLAVVSSTGTLAVFRLNPADLTADPLKHLQTSQCADLDAGVLFLQCCWCPGTELRIVAVTTSTGICRLLHLDTAWKITAFDDLDVCNSLEAWCIAVVPVAPDGSGSDRSTYSKLSAYCGGDDGCLRYTVCDVDATADRVSVTKPYTAVTMRGLHDAGVTAILPLPIESGDAMKRLVMTGSYDDSIRLFEIQDLHLSFGMKRTKLLAQHDLGGGVWRLNLVDYRVTESETYMLILASCMHAGMRIVEIRGLQATPADWSIHVVARFKHHKSMNYASAFMPRAGGSEALQCISTSFYDKLLCLTTYPRD